MRRNMGKLNVPDRWEKYTSIGKVVPGTRFLPFKTPLKEEICNRSLNPSDWFTPAMLLEKAPNIKLIIDLTLTDRFYIGKYFHDHGVRHQKIMCPGGGSVLPSRNIIKKFQRIIDDFLASKDGLNKDTLIGVHCTHGLNRTGYLICKYMVEHCGFSGIEAIEAFEEARGHKIERDLYTNDILNVSSSKPSQPNHDMHRASRSVENHVQRRHHPVVDNWRDESNRTAYNSANSYNWRSTCPYNSRSRFSYNQRETESSYPINRRTDYRSDRREGYPYRDNNDERQYGRRK